jgi:hypothetical protein
LQEKGPICADALCGFGVVGWGAVGGCVDGHICMNIGSVNSDIRMS